MPVQALHVYRRVIHIARRYINIGNHIEFVVDSPVVQVEKSFWFAFTHHVAALRVRQAHFPFFRFRLLLGRQRLFSVSGAAVMDSLLQLFKIGQRRLLGELHRIPVFVGICLHVCGIRNQQPTGNHMVGHCQPNHLIEDVLKNLGSLKPSISVPANRRMVGNLFSET
ncbi:hypothetical protein D3C86_1338160 [compost metagenome]